MTHFGNCVGLMIFDLTYSNLNWIQIKFNLCMIHYRILWFQINTQNVYIFSENLFHSNCFFRRWMCMYLFSCANFETPRMVVNEGEIVFWWVNVIENKNCVSYQYMYYAQMLCCYQVSIISHGPVLTLLELWEHNLFLYYHTAWYNTRNKSSKNRTTWYIHVEMLEQVGTNHPNGIK